MQSREKVCATCKRNSEKSAVEQKSRCKIAGYLGILKRKGRNEIAKKYFEAKKSQRKSEKGFEVKKMKRKSEKSGFLYEAKKS
jgi:hypothetical protein